MPEVGDASKTVLNLMRENRGAMVTSGATGAVQNNTTKVDEETEKKSTEILNQYNNQENWVAVRVWLPTKQGQFVTAHEAQNGGKIGHASIQTGIRNIQGEFTYASFWSSAELFAKDLFVRNPEGLFMTSPELDIINESIYLLDAVELATLKKIKNENDALQYLEKLGKKREPEVVVMLYTLNVLKIVTAFEKFKKSILFKEKQGFGNHFFNLFKDNIEQNCSGLVYHLLNAGGIERSATWDVVSRRWTVAPDAVARMVVQAAESSGEQAAAARYLLPSGVKKRIKKPNVDLNPNRNGIEYWMGQPQGAKAKNCLIM